MGLGVLDTLSKPTKDRAAYFLDLLKAEPTEADFLAACDADGLDKIIAETWWTKVQKLGWDSALQDCVTLGTKTKGKWEQVTGEKYGTKKAEGWTPHDWDPLWAGEDAEAKREAAQAALDRALAQGGADEAERKRLQVIVDQATPDLEALETAHQEAMEAMSAARDKLADAPTANDGDRQPCPHCGEAILLERHRDRASDLVITLKKPDGAALTPKEKEARRLARVDLEAAVRQAEGLVNETREDVAAAKRKLAEIEDAETNLAAMGEAVAATGPAADTQALRAEVQKWERIKGDQERIQQAADHHATIGRLILAKSILEPSGLRLRKLTDTLSIFNDRMAAFCEAAGWKPVTIHPDMSISEGPYHERMVSSSGLWRIGCAIQAAAIQIDGCPILVLDGAEILDRDGRNGLFRVLLDQGLATVMAMTAADPAKVPDLAAHGMGHSYWVEGGISMPLSEARAAMAQPQAAE
jgi:hypothetical protein